MVTVLILMVISLFFSLMAAWFVEDKLTTASKATNEEFLDKLRAQESRMSELESDVVRLKKNNAELAFKIGQDLKNINENVLQQANDIFAFQENLKPSYVPVKEGRGTTMDGFDGNIARLQPAKDEKKKKLKNLIKVKKNKRK